MTRLRLVIAGLGDTGLVAAASLARHADQLEIVGISPKPGWLSGRDLGMRLARPEMWARDYRITFDRLHRFDRVRTVHGSSTALDLGAREVVVRSATGALVREPYDVLVLATGVRNGSWRSPAIQDDAELDAELRTARARIEAASSLAVVGGGPTAAGIAAQVANAFRGKRVDLYFPGERALAHHHERVWTRTRRELERLGVGLHPGHRADLGPDEGDSLAAGPITFSTGQAPAEADLIVRATGRARPNTEWLPPSLLDEDGFVRVDSRLRVRGQENVWAVGDVAATDPLRASARNLGAELLARNVMASLRGRELRAYRPPRHRFGTVFGLLDDGMLIFTTSGRCVRVPPRILENVLNRATRRWMYGGVREP